MPGFEWFGEEEKREVQEVLETGVLFRYGFDQARKGRWKTRSLEKELRERMGTRYCYVCSSGTAALAIALASCGIGAGDQVIVPPFTFIATIEAVLHAGAVPVFSEIDETLCLDPDRLDQAVGPRTRAVLVVHMCGAMARIDEIRRFCEERELILLEDACQSVGGTYRGRSLGSFGRMGCLSFDSVKTITCGEGGAVVTDDEVLYDIAQAYADHGHDHIGSDRGLEGHSILGTNFRISELNAAVGLAQIRKLDSILEVQRKNKRALKEAVEAIPGVTLRRVPDEKGDSATFLSFFLPDESKARKVAKGLTEAGVDGTFYWYDNNWHYIRQWDHLKTVQSPARLPISLVKDRPDYGKIDLPQSDAVMGRTISILIKLLWPSEEVSRRVEKTTEVLKRNL